MGQYQPLHYRKTPSCNDQTNGSFTLSKSLIVFFYNTESKKRNWIWARTESPTLRPRTGPDFIELLQQQTLLNNLIFCLAWMYRIPVTNCASDIVVWLLTISWFVYFCCAEILHKQLYEIWLMAQDPEHRNWDLHKSPRLRPRWRLILEVQD